MLSGLGVSGWKWSCPGMTPYSNDKHSFITPVNELSSWDHTCYSCNACWQENCGCARQLTSVWLTEVIVMFNNNASYLSRDTNQALQRFMLWTDQRTNSWFYVWSGRQAVLRMATSRSAGNRTMSLKKRSGDRRIRLTSQAWVSFTVTHVGFHWSDPDWLLSSWCIAVPLVDSVKLLTITSNCSCSMGLYIVDLSRINSCLDADLQWQCKIRRS